MLVTSSLPREATSSSRVSRYVDATVKQQATSRHVLGGSSHGVLPYARQPRHLQRRARILRHLRIDCRHGRTFIIHFDVLPAHSIPLSIHGNLHLSIGIDEMLFSSSYSPKTPETLQTSRTTPFFTNTRKITTTTIYRYHVRGASQIDSFSKNENNLDVSTIFMFSSDPDGYIATSLPCYVNFSSESVSLGSHRLFSTTVLQY